jgi:hypothetical protein
VPVGLGEEQSEPLKVEVDLGRHLLRAHSGDGQRAIPVDPRGEAVRHRREHARYRPRVIS